MKKVRFASVVALSLVGVSLAGSVVSADIQTDVIDEKWGKPTLVYGQDLTDDQIQVVNNSFKVQDVSKVNRQVTTDADFAKYMGTDGSNTPSLISSTLVAKQDKGKGITVKIVTPENITRVTEVQYRNAAITAGASDVAIEVSAPFAVTGESALVGVSKALEANGQKVDTARAEVANQEVATTAQIAEANKGTEGFKSELLDNALIQVKTKLADYKKDKGALATKEDVKNIVKEALKANGLEGIVTDEQVNQLVDFASAYQNTSAIDSKEVLNQLGDLKDSISESVSGFLKGAGESGFFEKAGDFVGNLFKGISDFFSGFFN